MTSINIIFIITAIVMYVFTGGLVFLLTRTQFFKKQPEEDQIRAKKKLKIGLVASLIATLGALFLLNASTEIIHSIPVFLYIALWFLLAWVARRCYLLAVKRDSSLIKSRITGKQLKNPENLVGIYLKIHLAILVLGLALLGVIPLLKLPFPLWSSCVVVIANLFGLILLQIERKNSI